MDNFDRDEIEILKYCFSQFVLDKIEPSTYDTYKLIIDDYLDSMILGKVKNDDYTNMFQVNLLRKIRRKANTVRPSLLKFLDSLNQEGVINNKNDYLTAKNNIEEAFPRNNEKNPSNIMEFYTPQEIKVLFTDKITFKTNEEAAMFPLICALSFFCMMKQGEIAKLKMKDIDLENKRIRNVKLDVSEQANLAEWIMLDNKTFNYLSNYLKYRNYMGINTEYLLVSNNGKKFANNDFNRIFRPLTRQYNKKLLNGKSIKQEALIRTMMLYMLTSTKGKAIYDILLLHEPENKQFEYALKEYIGSMRDQHTEDYVISSYELSDIMPKKMKKPVEIKTDTLGLYSELNDVNEVDLQMYNEGIMNNRNLEEGKITIQRMVRNSKVAETLKSKYKNCCQLCGIKMRKANGKFKSEAHHIQPYNKIDRGDDNEKNMIVVCPNCHSQFDDNCYAIHPDTLVVHSLFQDEDKNHLRKLFIIEEHELGKKYLEYAWKIFEKEKSNLVNQD